MQLLKGFFNSIFAETSFQVISFDVCSKTQTSPGLMSTSNFGANTGVVFDIKLADLFPPHATIFEWS